MGKAQPLKAYHQELYKPANLPESSLTMFAREGDPFSSCRSLLIFPYGRGSTELHTASTFYFAPYLNFHDGIHTPERAFDGLTGTIVRDTDLSVSRECIEWLVGNYKEKLINGDREFGSLVVAEAYDQPQQYDILGGDTKSNLGKI